MGENPLNIQHCHLKYQKCVCYHIMKIRSFTRNIATIYINHFMFLKRIKTIAFGNHFSARHWNWSTRSIWAGLDWLHHQLTYGGAESSQPYYILMRHHLIMAVSWDSTMARGKTRNMRISNQLVEDWLFLIADCYHMRYCQRHLQGLPFPCGFVNDDQQDDNIRTDMMAWVGLNSAAPESAYAKLICRWPFADTCMCRAGRATVACTTHTY